LDLVSDPAKKRATYQDVLDAPEHLIAEIINGDLRLSPRPAGPHTSASSRLGALLMNPFDFGNGGPGGWIILDEPELHLGEDILVPDLAGWRRERMPAIADEAFFELPPDWVCEVLSHSTAVNDRTEKLPIYADACVGHVWLINPITRTLEVFRRQGRDWLLLGAHAGNQKVRLEPFDTIELDLSPLWSDLPPIPPRGIQAAEPAAEYEL
jgi:Uma2 family endonuclease